MGITLGICLAGILHYSIAQSETYRFGSRKFKSIIRQDLPKAVSIIPNVKSQSPVKILEVALPNSVLPKTTTKIPEEVTNEKVPPKVRKNPSRNRSRKKLLFQVVVLWPKVQLKFLRRKIMKPLFSNWKWTTCFEIVNVTNIFVIKVK